MAKAITNIEKQIPDPTEAESLALQQLVKDLTNRQDSLHKLLDIAGELEKLGVLDALQGMLKNSKQITLIGMDQLNKPGAHRMLKNGMGAVAFLTQVDPNKLQTLLNGVAAGIDQAVDAEANKKQGLWGFIKSLREREMVSSLSVMTRFLRGMGSALNKSP
jgi:uncharacterized protein YjgD (DUF1641 family)